jgi:hypothetical protein
MSRTYKDQPRKLEVEYDDRFDEFQYEAHVFSYGEYDPYNYRYTKTDTGETCIRTFFVKKAGIYTKKKRTYKNTDDWWYCRTPSWWVHDFMTVPKRAKCRNWEKDAVKHYDLEEIPDCPDYGDKPHHYYW